MLSKYKKITLIILIMVLVIASFAITYAFFSASPSKTNQTTSITTGSLNLIFKDNGNIGFSEIIHFGDTQTTGFTIENTGTLDVDVAIYWKNIVNSYLPDSLVYTLSYGEEGIQEANYETLVSNKNVPVSASASEKVLYKVFTAEANTTYNFKLEVKLVDSLTVDQTQDLSASFYSEFTIKEYTDIEYTSEDIIAALNITQNTTATPDFTKTAIDDVDGVFAMEDDYGMSYYYRGNITNNYVKFGKYPSNYKRYYNNDVNTNSYPTLALCETEFGVGKCLEDTSLADLDIYWRIIRINGNGSVRMIYDGTSAHANSDTSKDRLALSRVYWNWYYSDNKYEGYMFGGANGSASTSKEQAQTNETNSDMKNILETWYENVFANTTYEQYISDEIFCNDRSTAETPNTWFNSDTTLGYGTNHTYYGANNRIEARRNNGSKVTPSLICPQKNDAFTVDDEEQGNGYLTYPIGFITADEASIAGGHYRNKNKSYYLYKGNWYWTFSPAYFSNYSNNKNPNIFSVYSDGKLTFSYAFMYGSVAPVINLSAEAARQLIGDGTAENPYRFS